MNTFSVNYPYAVVYGEAKCCASCLNSVFLDPSIQPLLKVVSRSVTLEKKKKGKRILDHRRDLTKDDVSICQLSLLVPFWVIVGSLTVTTFSRHDFLCR